MCRAGFSGVGGIAATGDVVDVYTVQVVSRSPVGPVKGDGQRFETTLAVTAVDFDVDVVA